jgi:hypothetical protein
MAAYNFVLPFSWGDILWCAFMCLTNYGVPRVKSPWYAETHHDRFTLQIPNPLALWHFGLLDKLTVAQLV